MNEESNGEDHSVKDINSAKAVEYFEKKLNLGKIENSNINLSYTGPCKETMEFYVAVNDNKIQDIKFLYDGCSVLASCGSAICEMVRGVSLTEAKKIEPNDILKHLSVSTERKIDCPLLVVKTLRKSIEKYEKTNNSL